MLYHRSLITELSRHTKLWSYIFICLLFQLPLVVGILARIPSIRQERNALSSDPTLVMTAVFKSEKPMKTMSI